VIDVYKREREQGRESGREKSALLMDEFVGGYSLVKIAPVPMMPISYLRRVGE